MCLLMEVHNIISPEIKNKSEFNQISVSHNEFIENIKEWVT